MEKKFQYITNALNSGYKMHCFRSGGGLKVVRIEDTCGKLMAYGEHPDISSAFAHTDEDFKLGQQKYSDVYGGENAKYPHYLTGTYNSKTELDTWIVGGHTMDAWFENGKIIVSLIGNIHRPIPEEVKETVLRDEVLVTWSDRGYTYESTVCTFADENKGISTKCIKFPENDPTGVCTSRFDIEKRGEASTFEEAIENAHKAMEIEIKHKK